MKINKLIAPSSEAEIKSHWKYKDKVYISCICITFNHELYIRDALDSMLAQVSDYKFEIIVHDDLSTDKTRDILIDYRQRYPSIIKLILQDENQYSKGNKITPIAVSHAKGDYISLCEGDDYWICAEKIDYQAKLLMKNSHVNICFSAALAINNHGYKSILSMHGKHEKTLKTSQIIPEVGSYMPTASLFIRKEVFDFLPEWFDSVPVGDYYLQVLASYPYGAIFSPKVFSVYRLNSIGSWSEKRMSFDEDKAIQDLEDRSIYLDNLNVYLNDNFKKEVSLLKNKYILMEIKRSINLGAYMFYKKVYKSLTFPFPFIYGVKLIFYFLFKKLFSH